MVVSRDLGPDIPPAEPFQIEVSHLNDRALIAVAGEMDMSNSPGLLREVLAVLERPLTGITVDLGRVSYLDSAGVGTLVAAHYRAAERGIPFELVGVSDHARRIFEITDLMELFGLTG